jgi:hypothetical protein
MKKVSTLLVAGTLAFTLSAPAFAGSVGLSRSYPVTQPDAATIAELQNASQTALRQAREGNKSNPAFAEKSYEDQQVIADLQSGQQVDASRINEALQPVDIW